MLFPIRRLPRVVLGLATCHETMTLAHRNHIGVVEDVGLQSETKERPSLRHSDLCSLSGRAARLDVDAGLQRICFSKAHSARSQDAQQLHQHRQRLGPEMILEKDQSFADGRHPRARRSAHRQRMRKCRGAPKPSSLHTRSL